MRRFTLRHQSSRMPGLQATLWNSGGYCVGYNVSLTKRTLYILFPLHRITCRIAAGHRAGRIGGIRFRDVVVRGQRFFVSCLQPETTCMGIQSTTVRGNRPSINVCCGATAAAASVETNSSSNAAAHRAGGRRLMIWEAAADDTGTSRPCAVAAAHQTLSCFCATPPSCRSNPLFAPHRSFCFVLHTGSSLWETQVDPSACKVTSIALAQGRPPWATNASRRSVTARHSRHHTHRKCAAAAPQSQPAGQSRETPRWHHGKQFVLSMRRRY